MESAPGFKFNETEENWQKLVEIINELIQKFVPITYVPSKKSQNENSWITSRIRNVLLKKRKVLKEYRRDPNELNAEKFEKQNKFVKFLFREAKSQYYNQKWSCSRNKNFKNFFSVINELKCKVKFLIVQQQTILINTSSRFKPFCQ